MLMFLNSPALADPPQIKDLQAGAKKVKVFRKFELTFKLSKDYSNPYDAGEIDVTAQFESPAGKKIRVHAFHMQPCVKRGARWPVPQGRAIWKCRFTPNEEGKWTYRMQARDRDGKGKAVTGGFTVSRSRALGFVRRSKHDFRYFVRDGGGLYFAVGENIGWGRGEDPLPEFLGWIDKLAKAGGNFIRMWMAPWWTGLEWNDTGLGDYTKRQGQAAAIDMILDHCERRNVTLMLCLINHGKFSSKVNSNWSDSPYNKKNGGPLAKPQELWTSPAARAYLTRKWRYIVARWGHSPALHSWELWNEMEWTDDFKKRVGEAAEWHRESMEIIKELDPYDHLITTSFAGHPGPSEIWESGMEITQTHSYRSPDLAATARQYTQDMTGKYRVPYLLGEFGIDWDWNSQDRWQKTDPDGLALHNAHWGALMAGSAGSGYSWWWESYVDPRDLYYRFTGVARFAEGEDLDRRKYEAGELAISSDALRGYTLKSPNKVLGWVQCRASTWKQRAEGKKCQPVSGAALTLTGLTPGKYRLEWWDTVKGKKERSRNLAIREGETEIPIPDMGPRMRDRAFKLVLVQREK